MILQAEVSRRNKALNAQISTLAEGLKSPDYDEKAARRAKCLKELFPDDTKPFDKETWERECPDPDFEKVFEETEKAFRSAYIELGGTAVEISATLTPETLADIASALADSESVEVSGSEVPFEIFMRQLALLAV